MPTSASQLNGTRSGRNYYFTHKTTHLPSFSSEGKQVKNEQRIYCFKKADSFCQYILGISHEIYRFSTGAQNLAENRVVFFRVFTAFKSRKIVDERTSE